MSKSRNCTCTACGRKRIHESALMLPDGSRTDVCYECRHPDVAKTCNACGVAKPLTDFYLEVVRKDQEYRSRQSACKVCIRARRKASSSQRRLARYSLTPAQYMKMLASQHGRCAACGTDNPGLPAWSVDHDHACCPGDKSCGQCVRGLLCRACNVALGMVRDNPATLIALANYLNHAGFRGEGNTPVMAATIQRKQATGTQ